MMALPEKKKMVAIVEVVYLLPMFLIMPIYIVYFLLAQSKMQIDNLNKTMTTISTIIENYLLNMASTCVKQ